MDSGKNGVLSIIIINPDLSILTYAESDTDYEKLFKKNQIKIKKYVMFHLSPVTKTNSKRLFSQKLNTILALKNILEIFQKNIGFLLLKF